MLYKVMAERLKSTFGNHEENGFDIGVMIRSLREEQGKKAIDLARSSGVDPRTLTAIEKGRIKNPSLQHIQSIAHALNLSSADFFYLAESRHRENLYQGSQKGEFLFDFSREGFRLVSFTPLISHFFVGKVVMDARVTLEAEGLPMKGRIFVQVIIGKLMICVNQKEFFLKEGDHFLLNGRLPHTFTNPFLKESSFLLIAVPSFLNPS